MSKQTRREFIKTGAGAVGVCAGESAEGDGGGDAGFVGSASVPPSAAMRHETQTSTFRGTQRVAPSPIKRPGGAALRHCGQ